MRWIPSLVNGLYSPHTYETATHLLYNASRGSIRGSAMTKTPTPANVAGTPQWEPAREIVAQLREMPRQAAEAEIENGLRALLGHLFPSLRYPETAAQHPSGDGPIDVYCRNVVFETKREGRKADARAKLGGLTETPEEQAVRYLDALASRPSLFHYGGDLRACITDGKEWTFYSYNPDRSAPPERRLTPVREIRLAERADDDELLAYLHRFVNRSPPFADPFADVQAPNDCWAIDFKGWARAGAVARVDPLTLIYAPADLLLDAGRPRCLFRLGCHLPSLLAQRGAV